MRDEGCERRREGCEERRDVWDVGGGGRVVNVRGQGGRVTNIIN